jgi:hypothetical protein
MYIVYVIPRVPPSSQTKTNAFFHPQKTASPRTAQAIYSFMLIRSVLSTPILRRSALCSSRWERGASTRSSGTVRAAPPLAALDSGAGSGMTTSTAGEGQSGAISESVRLRIYQTKGSGSLARITLCREKVGSPRARHVCSTQHAACPPEQQRKRTLQSADTGDPPPPPML